MRDSPPVTISDPGDRGRGHVDVLSAGDEREPRLSRRTRVLGLAGLALVAVGAVGGTAWMQHRTDARERAAAFRVADEVHVEGLLVAVFGLEPGGGRVGAEVRLAGRAGNPGPHTVPSVRLEGPGIVPLTVDGPGRFTAPVQAMPESRVDCASASAGRLPDSADVVVTAVPPSQVRHEQRLPVDPAALREAVLAACDLPDPDGTPYVEVSAQDETLLLLVESVRRSDAALLLEDVRVPGFALTPVPGLVLPHRIGPDSSGFYGFRVAVSDCAVAMTGPLEVTVVLSEDGRREARLAPDAVRQRQPGAVRPAQLLQRVLERSC